MTALALQRLDVSASDGRGCVEAAVDSEWMPINARRTQIAVASSLLKTARTPNREWVLRRHKSTGDKVRMRIGIQAQCGIV